jgi:hypothetical protein
MCDWLIDKSIFQSQWVECFQLVSPKLIVIMQQINMILMDKHDHEQKGCT